MNTTENNKLGSLIESLLKSPITLIEEIREHKTSHTTVGKLLIISLLGFLIFGITLGSFSFDEQLWAAPLKTILGISLSTIICLPSLYIFSALTGTTLGLREIAQGMAASLSLIATLLLGFTPVLWVFSQSTASTAFFGTLVIITWLIALFFGAGFLFKMLKHPTAKAEDTVVKTTPLDIWLAIFLLVTLQMSTTLRPIIGSSDQLFTTEKLFFLEHWLKPFTRDRSQATIITEDAPQKKETPTPTRKSSQTNPYLSE